MAKYVRNHWYAAAWASELTDKPLPRKILEQPMVMFRGAEGQPVVLFDQCPHRLAPLSMGECVKGEIQCAYHGIRFNAQGRATHVPGQKTVPDGAKVHSYPAVERFGLVFVWMGDPERADHAKLPVIERHGNPRWRTISGGYQLHQTHYLNIVENLMDPAHTTFLHKQTIANPAAAETEVEVERKDDHVIAYRWVEGKPPSPNDKAGKAIDFERVDRRQAFLYYPPDMSIVDILVMEAGLEKTEENFDKGARTLAYKFITPETAKTSHFFWFHMRNYQIENTGMDKKIRPGLEQTYIEDNEICRELQIAQEQTGKRQFVFLAIDKAPRIAVQMIDRRLEAEATEGGSRPDTWASIKQ